VLIFVARPFAAFVASAFSPFNNRERLMLGWSGLRGAIPIWLATFPVLAGVGGSTEIFDIIFFVVVTSTLVQGASFEPLASRLGLTTNEPALPRRLLESGRIRRLGGDVISYRLRPGAAAAGHLVRELGLPREALVNVIVRDGRAIPPRGSTEVREGDELHILVRGELREKVEELTKRWHDGPVGTPPQPKLPPRGAPQIFSVGPGGEIEEPSAPSAVNGIVVISVLRSRRDRPSALVALADGRYALVSESAVAIGDRRSLANWCERRALRMGTDDPAEQAWWQETIGALIARG
jgi:cell volume regulation protein A